MYGVLLLTLVTIPSFLFSQNTNPASFELDGNLYTDSLVGTEDWFSSLGGEGGVIDASLRDSLWNIFSSATHPRQRNRSFVLGRNASGVLTFNGIDAFYQRDHISASSAKDPSTFITGASKNADNPVTWQVGLPGSPQKGDLVDIMALLRRDGGLGGDLWFFGGVSTRTADGNKHIDFEFYREELRFGMEQFFTMGTEGGRTAWQFGVQGEVLQVGDMIVSIDYLNGGTELYSTIRIWTSPNSFPNQDLQALNGFLPFQLTGVFDQGVNSGAYGYAEIKYSQSGSDPDRAGQ